MLTKEMEEAYRRSAKRLNENPQRATISEEKLNRLKKEYVKSLEKNRKRKLVSAITDRD